MKNSSQRYRQGQSATYQIQVQGWISERWADWFDDMTITVSDEDDAPAMTTLTGTVADQAALLGLLQKLYNLGLPLLLVRRREADCVDPSPEQSRLPRPRTGGMGAASAGNLGSTENHETLASKLSTA